MAMSNEDKIFLDRITSYANEVMPDLDPQKTQVSVQLEKMKPIFETLAKEMNLDVTDVFIKYMDLANEAFIQTNNKMKEKLGDLANDGSVLRFD